MVVVIITINDKIINCSTVIMKNTTTTTTTIDRLQQYIIIRVNVKIIIIIEMASTIHFKIAIKKPLYIIISPNNLYPMKNILVINFMVKIIHYFKFKIESFKIMK